MRTGRSKIAMLVGAAVITVGLTATVAGADSTTVVPSGYAQDGIDGNLWPFSCQGSQHYQQVYNGTAVGSGTISKLSFMPLSTIGQATIRGITVKLSTTQTAVDAVSTTFANNVGTDVQTVYQGDLTIVNAAANSFSVPITLQHPFAFNPVNGNLLLDITVPTCVSTTSFAEDENSNGVVGRAFTYGQPLTAPTGLRADGWGLVTEFTFGGSTITDLASLVKLQDSLVGNNAPAAQTLDMLAKAALSGAPNARLYALLYNQAVNMLVPRTLTSTQAATLTSGLAGLMK